jgi:ABC-type transporter Mla MlaB component
MLRVTPIQTERTTTLKLEGNLSGPWVDELRQCWAKLVAENAQVEVDLRGLNFLDPSGTTLLLRMERQGSRLFGSSLFIHNLLHTEALVRATRPGKSSKKES